MDLMKIKSFSVSENIVKNMERQLTEWEQIFTNHISDRALVFRVYKELFYLNNNNKKDEQPSFKIYRWRFLKELKIDLPYDPAIALLGIYPKDSDAMKRRDTCTPMFLSAMANSQTVEGASVSIER